MNHATAQAQTCHSKHYYLQKEAAVFSQIPGMDQLCQTAPGTDPEMERKYPDAAFALMIARNLHSGDHEQNAIHQKAYAAILRGESITGIQFKFDYDQETYLLKHMWD